jgi:membrane associated rhomboid family serine protease
LGRWRYLFLFLLSGVVAAVGAVAMDPRSTVPLAGPSGAVAGVVGGHLALLPRSRVLVLVPLWRTLDLIEMPALIVVAFWLAGQGLGQPGALAATLVMPLVGFTTGAGAAFVLRRSDRMRVEWWSP